MTSTHDPERPSSTRRIVRRLERRMLRWEAERVRRSTAAGAGAGAGLAPAAAGQIGLADRLVPAPVFVLSSIRSGSTLLRSVLDTHSAISAPHEMHLADLIVRATNRNLAQSNARMGLDEEELHTLLWDRVLHRQLVLDQKSVIVDKTPRNTFVWPRINRAWPQARYLILLRHPEAIARSLQSARSDISSAEHFRLVNDYATTLQDAREVLGGLVVRYERLTADPQGVTQEICAYLDVPWEPQMLEYGAATRGRFVRGLGDWSPNIRSGRIQPAAALPDLADVAPELRAACELLGYT